jgi:hypothetical protein
MGARSGRRAARALSASHSAALAWRPVREPASGESAAAYRSSSSFSCDVGGIGEPSVRGDVTLPGCHTTVLQQRVEAAFGRDRKAAAGQRGGCCSC